MMITNEQYQENVKARASKDFHADKLPMQLFLSNLLPQILLISMNTESAKKLLYYGSYSDASEEQIAYLKEQSADSPHPNNGWPTNMTQDDIDLLHAALGLTGELHELWDAIGKRFNDLQKELPDYAEKVAREGEFENVGFDHINCLEEFGDLLWYTTLGIGALKSTISEEMQRNDDKLETRYGPAYSNERQENRNLDAEREALERGQDSTASEDTGRA